MTAAGALPDTFYTLPPEWHWYVVLYFFFGGIAGGSFFIAALIDLFGGARDWPLARLGYYVSFVALLFCPIFLILDLTRPERFWHMMVQSKTFLPAFKYWSPISVGSWGLFLFGGFATLGALGALAEDGRIRWSPLRALRRGPLRPLVAALGGGFGFFLAGYTGVLLSTTNRVLWADTTLIGALFLASAATSAAALLSLLGHRRGAVAPDTLHRLTRFETWSSALELVLLVLLVVSLGQVARVWMNVWGALLAVAVILGILAPLAMRWRSNPSETAGPAGAARAITVAALVLVGSFLLRTIVVFSAQSV